MLILFLLLTLIQSNGQFCILLLKCHLKTVKWGQSRNWSENNLHFQSREPGGVQALGGGSQLRPCTVAPNSLPIHIVRLSIWFLQRTVGRSQAWLDCFEQYLQRARFVSQSLEWNGGQPVGFESNIGWNAGGSRASLQTGKTRTKTGTKMGWFSGKFQT